MRTNFRRRGCGSRLPAGWSALLAVLCLCVAPASAQQASAVPSDLIERGKILFSAGGCANCHTHTKAKGPLLAGGGPIASPFGTFYAPNITPDRTNGIGSWSDEAFIRAMRDGVSPGGSHYYPAFPYTSFTFMTEEDARAIKAYIFTLPPVAQPSRPHDIPFPFNLRFGMWFWKLLFFEGGPFPADPTKSAEWNRGAYLSRAVAHCGECHTPRNFLGALDMSRWFAGTAKGEGPEGLAVPNIRSDGQGGISEWSKEEIATYLGSGETPDGDFAGSLMAEVIENGTDRLSQADRDAIATYLKALPPTR